ncbi:MAG: 3'-5' exonuclease domain-containing protein 2 [Paludibacteraceae bacterium]|nr:3'-5' exonuclease domain-containing protein 2 [Candidatus Colicola coprequi]MCQ2333569.1 3'-5' exonuclease domain-containing protein 2 [Paludibacteraceae bacterium]
MKSNTFIHRIAKEQVQSLPLAQFRGKVIVVDTLEALPEAVAYLQEQKVLGVDTEARPSFTRGIHYPTALLQIASEERCYLFRLTHIGLPLSLAAIFANPNIRKVGLAFKDDINGLRRRQDFRPANCVDLQSIVGRYGILDLGLQKIFAICFGQKISKAQQLTNWENSHLTAEQAQYASTDAWATLLIYKELMRTQPLKKQEADALHLQDLERQQLHQQQVLAARMQAEN